MVQETGWDPFSDPADVGEESGYTATKEPEVVKAHSENAQAKFKLASGDDAPPDPWEDATFVSLVQEAAREAQERYESALKVHAEHEAKEEEMQKFAEELKLKAEQQARELSKLSPVERKQKLLEREAFAQQAFEHIRLAPSLVDPDRGQHESSKEQREFKSAEERETAIRKAAVQMAAADMGVKLHFKTKEEASLPVGLLFPDQGSRSLKMLKGLQELPEARRLRESAREILGFDPLEGPGFQGFYELLRGSDGWLEHTQYCQPAMYVTQVSAIAKLRSRLPSAAKRCIAVAGLSLGEYAALTFADVWDFEIGLRAVQFRGEAMEAVAEASPQGFMSVAGLSLASIEELCEASKEQEGDVCQVAQRLFSDGFTCSGSLACIERFAERARRTEGCKQVLRLTPAVAFHTPLMEEAREHLLQLLQGLEPVMRPPRVDVYMSGRKVCAGTAPSVLIRLLADQLTSCALWEDTVRAMLKDGVGEFYECGPLNQLKGVMKRIDPSAFKATISLDVYSQDWEMRPASSLPPRWCEAPPASTAADLLAQGALPPGIAVRAAASEAM